CARTFHGFALGPPHEIIPGQIGDEAVFRRADGDVVPVERDIALIVAKALVRADDDAGDLAVLTPKDALNLAETFAAGGFDLLADDLAGVDPRTLHGSLCPDGCGKRDGRRGEG